MSDFPHVNAAFINAIAEEGTKDDAVQFLQKQWNETCALRERLEQAERERDNYNAMYEQALITATQLRKYGFREGIEAAAGCEKEVGIAFGFCCDETGDEYNQGWVDCTEHWLEEIRALAAQKGE